MANRVRLYGKKAQTRATLERINEDIEYIVLSFWRTDSWNTDNAAIENFERIRRIELRAYGQASLFFE